MLNIHTSFPFFMEHSLIALTVAKKDDNVKALFALYHFDDTVFDEGLAMHNSITNLDAEQKTLHEKQYKAGRFFRKLMKIAREAFSEIDTLTDLAFQEEMHELVKLCTEVRRSKKQFTWMANAKKFFEKAIEEIQDTENDYVSQKYSKYGVTKEKLEAALQKVIDAETAKTEHVTLKGEAEEKIRERDAEVMIFYKWMKNYIEVAELAFKDKPQYMEKLAITKLSDGYKRKVEDDEKKEEEPPAPAESSEKETQPVEKTVEST